VSSSSSLIADDIGGSFRGLERMIISLRDYMRASVPSVLFVMGRADNAMSADVLFPVCSPPALSA